MNCVAEDIETIEQVKFLKKINVGIYKCYSFSEPVPTEKIPAILENLSKFRGVILSPSFKHKR